MENTIMESTVSYYGESNQSNIRTYRSDRVLIDVNKITYLAFHPQKNDALYSDEPIKIAMEHKGSKKQINAFVAITFDAEGMKEKGLSIFGPEKLNQFDRIVLDAINTLFVEGKNRYITLNMIYHVMTGSESKMISPQYAREINNSITKMMFTHIVIRADEEAVMYKRLKNFYYDSAILPAERMTAFLNGNEVACIHLERVPPLYVYANNKNQIARINIQLMQLPFANEKRETQNYMTLVYYLLRRIIALGRTSNFILYETLYHDLGYENETKQNKLAIRKRIKQILKAWTNSTFGRTKIIGYEEIKKSGVPYEIIIHFEHHKEWENALQHIIAEHVDDENTSEAHTTEENIIEVQAIDAINKDSEQVENSEQ